MDKLAKKIKVDKIEFWLSDGHHVVWDCIGGSYQVFRHGCSSRYVKTRRLPSLINALWIARNYPAKPLKPVEQNGKSDA